MRRKISISKKRIDSVLVIRKTFKLNFINKNHATITEAQKWRHIAILI